MSIWLDVVGIGEDGINGLSGSARLALRQAEVIIGGNRHHSLAPELGAERVLWPQPFSGMVPMVTGYRGRRTALLVTGDPLWFSAGARIARELPPHEVRFHPQISAFQLACARMRWSLADTETLTVHGRPVEQIIPWMQPGARLAVLTGGSAAPGELARLLCANGFGKSAMCVLGALGGKDESRLEGLAADWAERVGDKVPDFHTLCIECVADHGAHPWPRGPGLPDAAFATDGNFTKRDIRAVSVSMLAPRRGALLWDIGTGCGSIAVEWMRAAPDCRAIGIDSDAGRLSLARENAQKLGTPSLELIEGRVPEALCGLPVPDAVFIGGGLSIAVAETVMETLLPFGSLVANAVTLESESILAELHGTHGGELVRLQASYAGRLGEVRGWRTLMPVTQWRFMK
ncbi:MAG: precorrin-6y C5,15-methyltransferase (decarboxylating) subunit CbiE [Rhodobacteraceae bacterium]|nr:precorrin-6y C5,15-methyltransferase (decarboxylating) subunit CbiE [Paracoccaceae bacterium]